MPATGQKRCVAHPATPKAMSAVRELVTTPESTIDASSGARELDLGQAAPREPTKWFELRRDIPTWGYRALAFTGFAATFVFWVWLSHREFVNPIFLPTPEAV